MLLKYKNRLKYNSSTFFPEHGKREHGFVGLDLLRPLLADRSLLLCRAGLHDQEVR